MTKTDVMPDGRMPSLLLFGGEQQQRSSITAASERPAKLHVTKAAAALA